MMHTVYRCAGYELSALNIEWQRFKAALQAVAVIETSAFKPAAAIYENCYQYCDAL